MIDRWLALALGAGLAGLLTGIAATALRQEHLGVVAGLAALLVAVVASHLAARARRTADELDELRGDHDRLARELRALSAAVAEEQVRPAHRPDGDAAGGAGELDPGSGLLSGRFFPVIVRQRVAAARRQLQPVSVALLSLDGTDEIEARHPEAVEQAMGVLGDVVRRTLRECDAACRLDTTVVGAVLEDTAEAGAVWAVERVRGALQRSPVGDALTISAGIACYPSHALSATDLVCAARRALGAALAAGRDQVEVAPGD